MRSESSSKKYFFIIVFSCIYTSGVHGARRELHRKLVREKEGKETKNILGAFSFQRIIFNAHFLVENRIFHARWRGAPGHVNRLWFSKQLGNFENREVGIRKGIFLKFSWNNDGRYEYMYTRVYSYTYIVLESTNTYFTFPDTFTFKSAFYSDSYTKNSGA